MRHKVKVPPCQFCNKTFMRTEHLRRHERTHTKEKPHACICGRNFSRQDLLSRHVKLSKESEGHGPLSLSASGRQGNSDGTPEVPILNFGSSDELRTGAGPATGSALSRSDAHVSPAEAATLNPAALTNELDMLWDSFQLQRNSFELSYLSPEFPMNFQSFDFASCLEVPPLPETATPASDISGSRAEESIWQDDLPCASELLHPLLKETSRPPRPRLPNTSSAIQNTEAYLPSARNPCYMSPQDYDQISASVQDHIAILPLQFQLPTKHTLSRYIEGYSSFNLHRPFLHLSTARFSQMPLELVFAIAAMGAQYRFEAEAALSMYCAAKSIIDAKLNKVPAAVGEAARNSTIQARPALEGVASIAANSGSFAGQATIGIETIQAMVICMSLCSWEYQNLLPDAFTLAGQIVVHLRLGDFLQPEDTPENETWLQWIQREGRRRTIFIAFIIFNLHSIFYDTPPRLMAREIWSITMPQHEAHWWATTELEWEEMRRRDPPMSGTFGDYYTDMIVPRESRNPNHRTSAFGCLVSIHGLVQQIQLTRDTLLHIDTTCADLNATPLSEDVYMRFRRALCRWDSFWASSRESTTQPIAHMAPLGFNATAVFRIAWIRLCSSTVMSRNFHSRDPDVIAASFAQYPLPERSPRLYSAVLQSAHALSIPVRIGIRYASKTQILSWSIIHSIANLECALFLSKWLERASLDSLYLQDEEKVLVRVIARILKETPFFNPVPDDEFSATTIKHMAYSVLKLFTEMFKQAHLFDAIGSCIEAADRYASTLECCIEIQ